MCYSNLNEDEKRHLGIGLGSYNYSEFRNQVIMALKSYYGTNMVDDSGQKSIKIAASNNRLAADVVPCITYKLYRNWNVVAKGITFWTQHSSQQVINYPKLHFQNGAHKNDNANMYYKPAVRMFKNARERIVANDPSLEGKYPSYFVECLLYNVPDNRFCSGFAQTYFGVVSFLLMQSPQNLADFWCQNGQLPLFGNSSTQWDISQAIDFINRLDLLWEQW